MRLYVLNHGRRLPDSLECPDTVMVATDREGAARLLKQLADALTGGAATTIHLQLDGELRGPLQERGEGDETMKPWQAKWWVDHYGADAKRKWCAAQVFALPPGQRAVLVNGTGHHSSIAALKRRGLWDNGAPTDIGKAVREYLLEDPNA